VLTRNPNAVQIGLTATPRHLVIPETTKEGRADAQVSADNIRHFGEPVYEYDMSQGTEDGYLALCEIQKGRVNLDETGISIADIVARNPVDANTGQPITPEQLKALYDKTEFEDSILLPDRVLAMTQDFFKYLLETGGPEQKTIVFCVRDRHADDVAIAMNNLYAAWCKENGKIPTPDFAFKCTASVGGANYIRDLRGMSRHYFIATTVELLTTGVDVPVVRNIVFFKYVRSPIAFYQMVGRGTRLDPATNKLMFRVYGYTDATRLFGQAFISNIVTPRKRREGPGPPPPPSEPTIQVEGFDVHVTDAGRFILTSVEGRAMPVTVEEYKQRLAAKLVEEAPTLEVFRTRWITPRDRREMLGRLPDGGRSAFLVRALEDMTDYDLYDVLGELAYGLNPRTCFQRAEAFGYKHADWLKTLPPATSETLQRLAAQFARGGTDALENPHVFEMSDVRAAGGLPALRVIGNPAQVLRETKERIFAA
jgi:type I restriction enzyme R subunit